MLFNARLYTGVTNPRIIHFFSESVSFCTFPCSMYHSVRRYLDTIYMALLLPMLNSWRQMNKQGKQISHPLSWQQSIQTKHIGSKPAYLKSNFNYKYVLANMVVSDSHNFNATQFGMTYIGMTYQVLFMPFDRFLLAVESLDLSQADKSILRVTSFPSFTKL